MNNEWLNLKRLTIYNETAKNVHISTAMVGDIAGGYLLDIVIIKMLKAFDAYNKEDFSVICSDHQLKYNYTQLPKNLAKLWATNCEVGENKYLEDFKTELINM